MLVRVCVGRGGGLFCFFLFFFFFLLFCRGVPLLFKNLSFMVGYVVGLDCSLEFLVKEI
jgi:hypothetical protein